MKIEPGASAENTEQRPHRYFVADVHLNGTDSAHALKFRAFLERLAREGAGGPVELYVLGDLFEFWYEYRRAFLEGYRADVEALERAAQAGVQIALVCGNRDFGYGAYAVRRFGATLLGDGGRIVLNDSRPVWLEHGDLLCTADKRYLRFRRWVRSWPVRLLFRLLPWSWTRVLVKRVAQSSAADKQRKPPEMLALDLDAARARLERTQCRLLLCGHTHRPQAEDLGAGYRLVVLPAWCESSQGYVDDGGAFRPFEF